MGCPMAAGKRGVFWKGVIEVKDKKEYKSPQIRTEIIKVGVFGTYGGDDDDGNCGPAQFLNPFFRLCCS